MKKILLIILIVLFQNTFAQSDFFHFDQIKVNESLEIENKHNSTEYFPKYTISISKDYFPNATDYELAQPKVYNRPENIDFIPVQVEYFYTNKDSIVRLIVYNWDTKSKASHLRDFLKQENDESERFDEYNKEYDSIAKRISKYIGEPEKNQGKIEKKNEEGYGESYSRRILWKTEKCNVELILIWAERKGILGTYRIRTKIYWNKKNNWLQQ
ncbi:MAG: hypothetical protein COB12_10405 [Flavobacterium sp.]|nr:MAG: hypothetical protein COB12_10405 [Flavobacterium sp.]